MLTWEDGKIVGWREVEREREMSHPQMYKWDPLTINNEKHQKLELLLNDLTMYINNTLERDAI